MPFVSFCEFRSPPVIRVTVPGTKHWRFFCMVMTLVLTSLVAALHVYRGTHAGGLWRDEAAAVQLASQAHWSQVVKFFPHEAFPLLTPAVLRLWRALTGGGDIAFRVFGCLVGLAMLAALWWNSWTLRRRAPLIGLVLIGSNAAAVVWGDSIRGYGLGTVLIIVANALILRLSDRPSLGLFIAATLVAIASVQVLFQNGVLLLAICVSAAVSALFNRRADSQPPGINAEGAKGAKKRKEDSSTAEDAERALPQKGAKTQLTEGNEGNEEKKPRIHTDEHGGGTQNLNAEGAKGAERRREDRPTAEYTEHAEKTLPQKGAKTQLTEGNEGNEGKKPRIHTDKHGSESPRKGAKKRREDHQLLVSPKSNKGGSTINYKLSAMILAVGAIAALSLIPYWPALRGAQSWDILTRYDLGAAEALTNITRAFCSASWPGLVLWIIALLLLGATCLGLLDRSNSKMARYSGVALVLGVFLYLRFLLAVQHPVQAWHVVPLIGFCACLVEIGMPDLQLGLRQGLFLLIVVGLGVPWFFVAMKQARVRMTNVDLIAKRLNNDAQKGDFVVVGPWYCGVSFQRYYHGSADWTTSPALQTTAFHRYDLIKELMMQPDQDAPTRPVLERIDSTLKQGHKVWLVSDSSLSLLPPDVYNLPPAPAFGWEEFPYSTMWARKTELYLRGRARRSEEIHVDESKPVSDKENLVAYVFEP